MVFESINIRQVTWEVLKTAAFGLGFQHLPRDLVNINAWKTMFDPYITLYLPWWRSAVLSAGKSTSLPKYQYVLLFLNYIKPLYAEWALLP